jgi:hypothetical protein
VTESNEPYPWTRRQGESNPAYEAFRVYMTERSTTKVAEQLGKSVTLTTRWCTDHDWVERVTAYDRHLVTAETDGHAEELARVRSRHLNITDKLLDHLEANMDRWPAGHDPSIRWTQAYGAATKAHQAALQMKNDAKGEGVLEQILAKIERLASE